MLSVIIMLGLMSPYCYAECHYVERNFTYFYAGFLVIICQVSCYLMLCWVSSCHIVMLRVIMLCVIIIMLSIIMLSVILLIFMLSVMLFNVMLCLGFSLLC